MARYRLTDAQIRNFGPGAYHDGGGLYLEKRSDTSSSWVIRYQLNGRRQRMGLGSYAKGLTLKRARELADDAWALVAEGRDPKAARREHTRRSLTFEEVGMEYFATKKATLRGEGERGQWWNPVANHVLPKIGKRGVADLTDDDIVAVLDPIWKTKVPTATKVANRTEQILRYAAALDSRVDPTIMERARLRLGAVRHRTISHRALHWREIPKLWCVLPRGVVFDALRFYILTLPRASNVRLAEWGEIDLRNEVWTIPDDRMKSEIEFRAPLSWQAIAILSRVRDRSNGEGHVFRSQTSYRHRVISGNAWNNWFRANDWNTTAHGLRSTFRDWVEENQIADGKLAEHCIQHETRGKVERAYQRSDKLELRRKVMDQWADYVTGLTARDRGDAFELAATLRLEAAHREGRMLDVNIMDVVSDRDWLE